MQKTFLPIALTTAALFAQPPQIVEDRQVHVVNGPGVPGPGAGGFAFVSAEASFETSLVKGAPFTGEFVTENIQSLADGNRIRNANTTSYARDGEGRTRREITINSIGPFTGDSARKTIFIHDPVSRIDYVLDPQDRTARKIMFGGMTAPTPAAGKEGEAVFFNHRIEGPKDVLIEHGGPNAVTMERMPLPPGIVMHGQAGAVIRQKIMLADRVSPPPTAATNNFKTESLGKRIIEGLEAEGTRTTLTIPAGQIGNDRPLDTVSERWYSDELKTVVLTTRKDPRSGESTYKLTNLRRGEPARQLFELPPDYKLITEDHVGPRLLPMKIEKKRE